MMHTLDKKTLKTYKIKNIDLVNINKLVYLSLEIELTDRNKTVYLDIKDDFHPVLISTRKKFLKYLDENYDFYLNLKD